MPFYPKMPEITQISEEVKQLATVIWGIRG